MKNKVKKVIGTGLLCFMLTTIVGSVPALANNWTDTGFTFKFENAAWCTGGRPKEDNSKMYMKCTGISPESSYTAHPVGSYSTSPDSVVNCTYNNYTYQFKSAGQSYYMYNLVYERKYPYGAIAASPNYAFPFIATGVWSPDNLNHY